MLLKKIKLKMPLTHRDVGLKTRSFFAHYWFNIITILLSAAALIVSIYMTVQTNQNSLRIELGVKKTDIYGDYLLASTDLYKHTIEHSVCLGDVLRSAQTGQKIQTEKINIYTEDGLKDCQAILDDQIKSSISYSNNYSKMLLVAPPHLVKLADKISASLGFTVKEGYLPSIDFKTLNEQINSQTKNKNNSMFDLNISDNFPAAYSSFRKQATQDIDLNTQ